MSDKYDIIILGGGNAGLAVSAVAHEAGKRIGVDCNPSTRKMIILHQQRQTSIPSEPLALYPK